MSLTWFHVAFISISVVLAVGVAFWAVQSADWLLAFVALASGAALLVYRGAFLRKATRSGLR